MLTATKAIPTIVGIIIANNTGGAIAATMRWGNGSTDYDVLAAKSVAANDSYINNDVYLPLREGHTIKVTSATGNALTFTLVIVETGSALPNVSGR